MVVKIIFLIPW